MRKAGIQSSAPERASPLSASETAYMVAVPLLHIVRELFEEGRVFAKREKCVAMS